MHRFCLPQGGRLRFFVLWVWLLLGLLQAIEMKVEMINRMAHLTPVQTYRSAVASGVSVLEAADEVVKKKFQRSSQTMQKAEIQESDLNFRICMLSGCFFRLLKFQDGLKGEQKKCKYLKVGSLRSLQNNGCTFRCIHLQGTKPNGMEECGGRTM